jgi:hypothetical protein
MHGYSRCQYSVFFLQYFNLLICVRENRQVKILYCQCDVCNFCPYNVCFYPNDY